MKEKINAIVSMLISSPQAMSVAIGVLAYALLIVYSAISNTTADKQKRRPISMKRTLALLVALLILLAAAGCHDDMPLGVIVVETDKAANATEKPDDPATTGTNTNTNGNVNISASYPAYTKKDGTWAIYMYICGADLESGSGLASMDIDEVLKAKLPDNVNVVMEMGGAKSSSTGYTPKAAIQPSHQLLRASSTASCTSTGRTT